MKRLIADIENSPNLGYFFQLGYKETIHYNQLLKERAIICICAKYEGEKKLYRFIWKKNWNDERVLSGFAKLGKASDELVFHNGDKFDLPMMRARAIRYGIDFSFPIVAHDTLKIARSQFKFNSNRLDYLAQYLGVGGKISTGGFELWQEVCTNNEIRRGLGLPTVPQKQINNALKKMVRYCDNDVIILEKVWNKLKPYAKHKSSVAETRVRCPECNGICAKQRTRVKASGHKTAVMKCNKCGKHHTLPLSIYNKLTK